MKDKNESYNIVLDREDINELIKVIDRYTFILCMLCFLIGLSFASLLFSIFG